MQTRFSAGFRQAGPWIAVLAVWGSVFALSCLLAPAAAGLAAPGGSTAAGVFLGEARSALGDEFFRTADLYFHRGVSDIHAAAPAHRLFQRALAEVSPQVHTHLQGEGVGEIMPWLWLSVRANPHHVEAYLVAAFWLARDVRRPDLAADVLREARISNPANCRVPLEQGRLLLAQGRLAEARRALDAGLTLWPGGEADEEDARLDKRNLLLHRALIEESFGEKAAAVADLKEILRLYPAMTSLSQRVADLEKGVGPAVQPLTALTNLLEVQSQLRAECPDERAGAHDHDADVPATAR